MFDTTTIAENIIEECKQKGFVTNNTLLDIAIEKNELKYSSILLLMNFLERKAVYTKKISLDSRYYFDDMSVLVIHNTSPEKSFELYHGSTSANRREMFNIQKEIAKEKFGLIDPNNKDELREALEIVIREEKVSQKI